ncbi:hypothetical protein [Marivirga sp.]|uniref:hypothetical protein n=1 Tax=Marivirga sp. TaxID=2018662 RepID=UPI002D7E501F|nr:hypothetical protein [Marivirga sp.]HET8859841.1 hypothetical protein [Marivirga sp.]
MEGKELGLRGKRINLGSGRLDISEKNARIFNFIVGFLFLGMTLILISNLLNDSDSNFVDKLHPLAYFLIAIFYLGKAGIVQSKTSKYAPHFIISDNVLKIKTSVFKKSEHISWNDIKKIELGNFKIGLKLNNTKNLIYYPYTARKDTSIDIKRSIKAIAVKRGIEVENLLK